MARLKTKKMYIVAMVLFICALFIVQPGCSQPGETTAEGHRRHLRNLRVNQQELVQDVDKALLMDEPSKLTNNRAE